MADSCIEQALSAMNHVWAHQGTMTVAIPQIADAFAKLQGEFRALRDEQHKAAAHIQDQDVLINRMHQELSSIKSTVLFSSNSLSSLLQGANSIVRHDDLLSVVRGLADGESHKLLQEVVSRLQARVMGMTDEATIRNLLESSESNKMAIEALTQRTYEDARNTKSKSVIAESEAFEATKSLNAHFSKLSHEIQRVNAAMDGSLNASQAQLLDKLDAFRGEANLNLTTAVTDIVEHMKAQALAVEELQAARLETEKNAPSKDEVVQMRVEMDVVKKDIERAHFKIHEAYSQCIAIAKHTGQQGGGSQQGSSNTSSTSAGNVSGVARSSMLPAKRDAVPGGFEVPRTEALPTGVEVQLELLKRDVKKLWGESVPQMGTSIAAVKDQLDAVVAMHLRANAHGEAFFNCLFGNEDAAYDELMSSLASRDGTKLKLIIRRIIAACGIYTEQGLVASSTSYDSGAAGRQQGSAVAATTRGPALQLGVDLADYVDSSVRSSSGDYGTPALTARRQRLPSAAQVMHVEPHSLAARIGLQAKDKIIKVGDVHVTTAQSFVHALRVAEAAARTQEAPNGGKDGVDIIVTNARDESRKLRIPF